MVDSKYGKLVIVGTDNIVDQAITLAKLYGGGGKFTIPANAGTVTIEHGCPEEPGVVLLTDIDLPAMAVVDSVDETNLVIKYKGGVKPDVVGHGYWIVIA